MKEPSILIIDDDPVMQTLFEAALKPWRVICHSNLNDARAYLSQSPQMDGLLIDIDLPDGDGLRFLDSDLKEIRESGVPIFVVSGHKDIAKKVMAFHFGVDDFLTKPFDPLELKVRLESRINKRAQYQNERKVGNILLNTVHFKSYMMRQDGAKHDLGLTTIEMKILLLLTEQLERVFTRDQMIDAVWQQVAVTDRNVDSHVAHLRKKLKDTNLKIKTVQNIGYSATVL